MKEKPTVLTEEQQRNQRAIDLMFKNHLQMTWRVFAIIVLSLGIFGGGGYLLDMLAGTKPLFLIIGIVLGFIASQVLNVIVFSNLTKK